MIETTTTEQTFPKIPSLKSTGSNLDAWKGGVIQTLRFHGLTDYILGDTATTKTTSDFDKAYITMLLMDSASSVMPRVAAAGWDFSKVDQDPKDMYELIICVTSQSHDEVVIDLQGIRNAVRTTSVRYVSGPTQSNIRSDGLVGDDNSVHQETAGASIAQTSSRTAVESGGKEEDTNEFTAAEVAGGVVAILVVFLAFGYAIVQLILWIISWFR